MTPSEKRVLWGAAASALLLCLVFLALTLSQGNKEKLGPLTPTPELFFTLTPQASYTPTHTPVPNTPTYNATHTPTAIPSFTPLISTQIPTVMPTLTATILIITPTSTPQSPTVTPLISSFTPIPESTHIAVTATPTPVESPTPTPSDQLRIENQILILINLERMSRGLIPLRYSVTLESVARAWSTDMARFDNYRHGGLGLLAASNWRSSIVSEIIARGWPDAQSVVRAWMGSQSHREAILNPLLLYAGAGYALGTSEALFEYYTVIFSGEPVR